MNQDLLLRGLAELGLSEEGALPEGLGRYLSAIEAWNPTHGLVGAMGDELVIKHGLDSLAPLAILDGLAAKTSGAQVDGAGNRTARRGITLADLGTGAGLPGIPLALARPSWKVSLIDRMTRRIKFLEAMRIELPLPTVEIIEEQVEHAKGAYDLVTFRAFRPFERKLFKRIFAICAPGGYIAAYKGRREKVEAELTEIEGLYASVEILPVTVPFLPEERCLVVLSPRR